MLSLTSVTSEQIKFLLTKLTFSHEIEWSEYAEHGIALGTTLLLVSQDKTSVGFVLFSFTDPRTIYLDLIDIAEEHRNKGVACDVIAYLFTLYKNCIRLQGQSTCEALFFWCRIGARFQDYNIANLHEAILNSEFPMFFLSRKHFELYYTRKKVIK